MSGERIIQIPTVKNETVGSSSKGWLKGSASEQGVFPSQAQGEVPDGYQALLTAIYMPMRAELNVSAGGALLKVLEPQVTVLVTLYRGPYPAWIGEQRLTLPGNIHDGEHEGGPEYYEEYFRFAEAFTSPIPVVRNQALSITTRAVWTARSSTGEEPTNMNASLWIWEPGVIRYELAPETPGELAGGESQG